MKTGSIQQGRKHWWNNPLLLPWFEEHHLWLYSKLNLEVSGYVSSSWHWMPPHSVQYKNYSVAWESGVNNIKGFRRIRLVLVVYQPALAGTFPFCRNISCLHIESMSSNLYLKEVYCWSCPSLHVRCVPILWWVLSRRKRMSLLYFSGLHGHWISIT